MGEIIKRLCHQILVRMHLIRARATKRGSFKSFAMWEARHVSEAMD